MKIQCLIIFLAFTLFSQQSFAPPIKGGATGGAKLAGPDISKCDLNPAKQTKVKVKDKDGGEHFICTGQAICGGKTFPVSCKVSEREPCPTAKVCIVFRPEYLPYEIPCNWIRLNEAIFQAKNALSIVSGPVCGRSGEKNICLSLSDRSQFKTVYASTLRHWKNIGETKWKDEERCFYVTKEIDSCHSCPIQQKTLYKQDKEDIKWATDKYHPEDLPR